MKKAMKIFLGVLTALCHVGVLVLCVSAYVPMPDYIPVQPLWATEKLLENNVWTIIVLYVINLNLTFMNWYLQGNRASVENTLHVSDSVGRLWVGTALGVINVLTLLIVVWLGYLILCLCGYMEICAWPQLALAAAGVAALLVGFLRVRRG